LLAMMAMFSTTTSLHQHRVHRPERHLIYEHVLNNRTRNFRRFHIPSKSRAKRRLEQNPVFEPETEIEDEEVLWSFLVVADSDENAFRTHATKSTRRLSSTSFVGSIRRLYEQFVGQEDEGGLTNATVGDSNITANVTDETGLNGTAIFTAITNGNVTVNASTTDEEDMDVFEPIRLRVILAESTGNGNLLLADERRALFQEMLRPALLSWSNALRVDPVVGNLTVDVTQLRDGQTCGPGIDSGLPSVPVPRNHLTLGIPDTDTIIYLSLGFSDRRFNASSNLTSTNSTEGKEEDEEVNGEERYLEATNDTESSIWQQDETNSTNRTEGDIESLRADAVCSGDYLAAASFCSTDQYDRPTAALMHLCIDEFFFNPENQHRNILSLMHEMGHALGFNSQSMAHFRKVDGTPYTERVNGDIPETEVECTGTHSERKRGTIQLPSEEILQFREVRGGVRVAEIVTPSVLQVVRNQFGCQNLTGAELESGDTLSLGTPEEGYGCIGDHWERRLFSSDIMNPVVDDLEYYPRISTLTMAYFADSGWYQVDLSGSRVASGWGRGAGCGFVNEACIGKDGQVPHQNAPFFCNAVPGAQTQAEASEVKGCTSDLSRKAVCSMGHYGLDLPWEYRYFKDSYGSDVGGNDPLMDYCPVYTGYDNGLCSSPFTKDFMSASHVERFGERNSRCLVGSLDTRVQQQTALCLPIACVVEDRSLRVKISQKWHRCEEADQEISHGSMSVLCPDPRRICPTFYCPYDCLGTGGQCDYSDGQCLCEVVEAFQGDNMTVLVPCGEEALQQPLSGSVILPPDEEDQKDELPHPDSPLSDYYVPTERALEADDSNPLASWVILLISLGVMTFAAFLAILYLRFSPKPDDDSRWAQAWLAVNRFNVQDDSSGPVGNEVDESRSRNKDKMIATVLVDLRMHNNALNLENLADTDEQLTESDASRGFQSEASSDYSGARSDTLSEVNTSLDNIAEGDIQASQEDMQVIRRRRFLGSN